MFQQQKALLEHFVRQNLKRAQNNTVLVQQEEMDRVGFEPTTSAWTFLSCSYYLSKMAVDIEREIKVQIPPAPLFTYYRNINV
jgi:hypothetical protein